MRKEAINTMSEGLIMDLNPLTTPSNVMTSCLNGTMITYNGNEFVLQNDMGNGRVETAYLPAGYVPVGMKEHGGIIYIASYNPLTNKGQIGSFPSPERNISSNEIGQSDKTITLKDFKGEGSFSTTYKLNLFNGAKNLVLRSGDKFGIAISGSDDLRKYISNYCNVTYKEITDIDGSIKRIPDKVKSPKNKVLTLRACIIDANNNLRDITPQLKRVNIEEDSYDIIEFDNLAKQTLKENSGFYAQPTKFDKTIDLAEYRKNKAFNVYNNKVFGELYIVATLNTIQRIDFSVIGTKSGNKADLRLIMTYYYNCPDGFYDQDGDTDDTVEGNKTNEKLHELYSNSYNIYKCIFGKREDTAHNSLIKGYKFFLEEVEKDCQFYINSIEDVTYMEEENLYKVVNVHKLSEISINSNRDIRSFSATPAMTYAELPGLTVNGTIDLAKLGSGEIYLNGWRYFCTQDTITLTWGFEAYLKDEQIVNGLQFEFYNADTGEKDYVYSPTKKYSYTGSFTDVLTYGNSNKSKLEYGKLYLVLIKCKLNTIDNAKSQEERTFARWMLTTGLYNEYYFKIMDFMDFTQEQLQLNNISLDVSYDLKDFSSDPSTLLEPYSPNTASSDEQILMGYKINSKQMQISCAFKYKNAEKYPFKAPSDRYFPKYTIDQEDSQLQWEGVVEGTGKIPDSVAINITSTQEDDWNDRSFNLKKNVVIAEVSNQGKVTINYKAISFILGNKFQKQRAVVYSKVLSKYGNRMDSILGAPVQQGITPPYATQLIFRRQERGGRSDYHGYGYFPIQFEGISDRGWKLLRNYETYVNYAPVENGDRTITYYANQGWAGLIGGGIKEVLTFTPLIIFMTYNVCRTPPGNDFYPGVGVMQYSGGIDIKSLVLWHNGDDYGMVKGFTTNLTGAGSMLYLLQNDFNNLYIRQEANVNKQGYLIDPQSSSYVSGGFCKINTTVKVGLEINDKTEKLPKYLKNISTTVNSIVKDQVSGDIKERLAQLMTFEIDENMSFSIPIQFQDKLVNMQPSFGQITLLTDNPFVNTPVIIDDDTVYYQDAGGFAIDESKIYAKEGDQMKLASTSSGFAKNYADTFNVKTFNGEYHLVPKKFVSGSPQIWATSDGSNDSNSILNFDGIKMVDLKIGNNLV